MACGVHRAYVGEDRRYRRRIEQPAPADRFHGCVAVHGFHDHSDRVFVIGPCGARTACRSGQGLASVRSVTEVPPCEAIAAGAEPHSGRVLRCRSRIRARPSFPGRGRAHRGRVEPGVAGAEAGTQGCAQRVVHRARRHGFRAAGLFRRPDRHAESRRARDQRSALQQHAHDGALLAEPVVHCHRPQPPQQRHGVRHGVRYRLSRLRRQRSVRERLPLRDAARTGLQHLHGRQVAPDPGQPGVRRRTLRPLAAGPRFRALLRVPRRRYQPVESRPRLRQPSGRAAGDSRGGLPPDTRPRRQGDAVHRRRQAGRPRTSRSTCTSALARPMPRTMSRRNGPTSTPGSSTTDGTPTAPAPSPARRSSASCRPTASSPATTPTCPDWDSLSADQRRLYAREMEVFAGFLSHTDHHIGRLIEFLRTIGQLDNTLIMVVSDNGASAEGGVTGTTNEARVLQQLSRTVRGQPQGHRRARRSQALQSLPVGLDLRREHAVPPVEARDLPRRRE